MATDTKSGRTACTKYEALLEDYLKGDLASADAARMAEHLNACSGCRESFEEAKSSVRLLQLAAPAGDPGPGFARQVMARIRAAEAAQSSEPAGFWQPFVWLGWRFAVTATLALGLLVTYDAGWANHSQPNLAVARPTLRDIFPPDPAQTAPTSGDETLMMVADTSHANN